MARVAVRIVTAFGAEELISGTAGYLPQWAGKDLRHTDASFAGFAALAVRIDAALRADQLISDAASDQTALAEDDVRLAEAIDAGGAFAAVAGFAAFIAVDTFDDRVRRWTGDAAMLIFWTNGNAR